MGEYTDRLTYGVDLDGGPDRPIHDLVHGVSPLPNLRPGRTALLILLHGARCSGPPGAAAGGLLNGGQQLRRAWWAATPLDRFIVSFPGRISCETLVTNGTDVRSLSLLRF